MQLNGASEVCEVYANAHDDVPVAQDVPLNDALEQVGDSELDVESVEVDEADELDEFPAGEMDDVQDAAVDEQHVFPILDALVVVCPAEEDGGSQESMELDFDRQLDRRKGVRVLKAFLVQLGHH